MVRRAGGIGSGHAAAPYKNVQIAIPVKVGRHGGTAAVADLGQLPRGGGSKSALAVIPIEPVLVGEGPGIAFDPAAHNVEVGIPVAFRIQKQHAHVLAEEIAGKALRGGLEAAGLAGEQQLPAAITGAAEEEVVPPVPIHIAPRVAGPELRHGIGKQGLAGEVIVWLLLVNRRRERRIRRKERHRRGSLRQIRGLGRLGDGVAAARRKIFKNLLPPAGPTQLQPADRGVGPQTKVHQRLIGAQITTGQGELPDLDAGGGLHPGLHPGAKVIRGGALELEGHPVPLLAVIAVDDDRLIETHADKIEIAIAIQIARRTAKTHAGVVQSPGGRRLLEGHAAGVPPGHVGFLERGQLFEAVPLGLGAGVLAHFGIVLLIEIPGHPRLDKNVIPSVIIEITEPGRP